jgi:hypothetical protein
MIFLLFLLVLLLLLLLLSSFSGTRVSTQRSLSTT